MTKEIIGSLELNRIYQMDCLEGMRLLPDNSIKTIITSPPYNLGGDFHTMVGGKRITYGDYKGSYSDNLDEETYQKWQIDFLNNCYRVLKDEGFMFYNHKNRIKNGSIISPFEWITKSSFNISQIVVVNLKSTANVDKRRFFPVYELIFVLNKSKKSRLVNDECLTDVWELKKVPRKVSGHPATFHIELPRRCIKAVNMSKEDVVLDPFAGTGTTCRAAKELGFKFLGFEIEGSYVDKFNSEVGLNE